MHERATRNRASRLRFVDHDGAVALDVAQDLLAARARPADADLIGVALPGAHAEVEDDLALAEVLAARSDFLHLLAAARVRAEPDACADAVAIDGALELHAAPRVLVSALVAPQRRSIAVVDDEEVEIAVVVEV